MRLVTIYRPPVKNNTTSTTKFLSEFSALFKDLAIFPGPPLFVGDFNFYVDVDSNRDATFFSDLLNMLWIISAC